MRVHVVWDLSDTEAEDDSALGPPGNISVPNSLWDDEVTDWLSDTYGFTLHGWTRIVDLKDSRPEQPQA
jgi:hypothetical protein